MPRQRMPKSRRSVPLAVYVPPSVLRRLKEIASRDRRTVSNQALVYIERGLKGDNE